VSEPLRLSIVVPLYNEREGIAATLESVVGRLAETEGFAADVVVVDDGSSDGGAEIARSFDDRLPLRVRSHANSGRFRTRQVGLEEARGDYVLFLDAGVVLAEGGLRFIAEQVPAGKDVWNAHTLLVHEDNPFGVFWSVVSALAFADYLDDPRTTSFGAAEFDRYPKGTGCFFAPRRLLRDAFASFSSAYVDTRYANDDAPILRAVATRSRINISPEFACVYRPRTSLVPFVRHAFHRGTVFVDGHGRRESRFFPLVIGFYPASIAFLYGAIREPVVAPGVLVASSVLAGVAARRQSPRDAIRFAALAPVYAVAHGLGMWRGLFLAVAKKLHR
jgi:glycosyltransferase involved in cell wall biosynthesis